MEPKRLADLLHPQSVLVPLVASGRDEAIAALVDAIPFVDGVGEKGRRELAGAALAREKAGSTGIGDGVAIPHARSSGLTAPRLSVGLSARPIDFRAADGKPVTLAFFLAVPQADPKSHLKTLAALSRAALDKKLLRRMTKAGTPEELYGLLADWSI